MDMWAVFYHNSAAVKRFAQETLAGGRTEKGRFSIATVKYDAEFPLAMEKTTDVWYNVAHENP